MSLRGILRGFGLKVGRTTKAGFASRIMELTEHHPALEAIAKALLAVHEVLLKELNGFEKQVRKLARCDARVRLLMTAPGVGAIVGLTYVAAIDDPARFSSSKTVGAHFGMTPKKYQSGETDVTGRISKMGDKGVRAALYEAAHIILTMPVKGGALKSWAAKLAKRAGMQKAKVALARKLAVILHRMLADGAPFDAAKAAAHERPRLHQRWRRARGRQHRFRAACGGGLRPVLTAAARGAFGSSGRDGETPFSRTKKLFAAREKHPEFLGRINTSLPEAASLPGRWIGSGRNACRRRLDTKPGQPRASKIGPALSSSNTIRRQPSADPVQKHDPGSGCGAKKD